MALAPLETGFRFTQASASTTWTIAHNLNVSAPVVDCWESDIKVIPTDVTVTDSNNIVITFSIATAGKAYIV